MPQFSIPSQISKQTQSSNSDMMDIDESYQFQKGPKINLPQQQELKRRSISRSKHVLTTNGQPQTQKPNTGGVPSLGNLKMENDQKTKITLNLVNTAPVEKPKSPNPQLCTEYEDEIVEYLKA